MKDGISTFVFREHLLLPYRNNLDITGMNQLQSIDIAASDCGCS